MISEKFRFYVTELDHVTSFHARNITHLISIGDFFQKKPFINHFPVKPAVFRLEFKDIRQEDDKAGPQETHIKTLLGVAKLIKDRLEQGHEINLLIHCFAGVSRSTAAAYIVLNYLAGPGKEQECLNEVFHARSCMIPNEAMIAIADRLLDRKGEMLRWVTLYNQDLGLQE